MLNGLHDFLKSVLDLPMHDLRGVGQIVREGLQSHFGENTI